MALISTRGNAQTVPASQAVLRGLASDGGLYVPQTLPRFSEAQIAQMAHQSYQEIALTVLSALLNDLDGKALAAAIGGAYARFSAPQVAPLLALDKRTHVLELFHGPTLAFKDIALQLLPRLTRLAMDKQGEARELLVLVATSGDTGKAALEGFMDVPGTRCAVFYPQEGVSAAQRLQMTTQAGSNTHVIAVKGNFDDAQTGVKAIFADPAFNALMEAQGRVLSSANSINFGRLAPQVVYYFAAYARLLASGAITLGQKVNVAVPTGNFGNILAAYYAGEMGLPLGKLLCASNANRVLADFIQTGVYDTRRDFLKTLSPSMDILISSNLERLLFELADRDAATVRGWMGELAAKGRYDMGSNRQEKLAHAFAGGWADDHQTQAQIKDTWAQHHYLCDTHTAVALHVLNEHRQDTGDSDPWVVVSTASPYKFGWDVAKALLGQSAVQGLDDFQACALLAKETGGQVPPRIAELPGLPLRHRAVVEPKAMPDAVLEALKGNK